MFEIRLSEQDVDKEEVFTNLILLVARIVDRIEAEEKDIDKTTTEMVELNYYPPNKSNPP